jgi:hypothetical protein
MRQIGFAVKKIGRVFSTSVWKIYRVSRETCVNASNHDGFLRAGGRWIKTGICTNLGR